MEAEIRRVSDRVFGGRRPRQHGKQHDAQAGAEFRLDGAQESTLTPTSASHVQGAGEREGSRRMTGEREIGGRLDVSA